MNVHRSLLGSESKPISLSYCDRTERSLLASFKKLQNKFLATDEINARISSRTARLPSWPLSRVEPSLADKGGGGGRSGALGSSTPRSACSGLGARGRRVHGARPAALVPRLWLCRPTGLRLRCGGGRCSPPTPGFAMRHLCWEHSPLSRVLCSLVGISSVRLGQSPGLVCPRHAFWFCRVPAVRSRTLFPECPLAEWPVSRCGDRSLT